MYNVYMYTQEQVAYIWLISNRAQHATTGSQQHATKRRLNNFLLSKLSVQLYILPFSSSSSYFGLKHVCVLYIYQKPLPIWTSTLTVHVKAAKKQVDGFSRLFFSSLLLRFLPRVCLMNSRYILLSFDHFLSDICVFSTDTKI